MFMLAARNLLRNKRRSLLTVAGIGFGLGMVEVMISLQAGQYAELLENGISSLAGHVVVQADGWQEDRDEELVFTGAGAMVDELRRTVPDATVTPRLLLGGLLTSPRGSVGAALTGVDGAAEGAVQTIDGQVKVGTWLDGDARGIVVGQKLAESLQVDVGDKVVWMGQHGDQTEVTSRMFRIKGIFRTGAPELDGFVTFAELPAVQEVYGTPDVAHQVAVHLTEPGRTPEALAAARSAVGGREGVVVLPWDAAVPQVVAMIAIDRTSNDIIMFVIGTIVSMGALNTVLMSAMERTREFGVMLALGLRPAQLGRLILTEGVPCSAWLGAVCSGLRCSAATVSWPLVHLRASTTATCVGESVRARAASWSRGIVKRPVRPLPRGLGYASVAVLFLAIAAAIYPAWRVTRLTSRSTPCATPESSRTSRLLEWICRSSPVRGLTREYHAGPVHRQRAPRASTSTSRPGEFTALMGPSGSGKTTLLNLIGGLDEPNAGSVMVDGHDLATLISSSARSDLRRNRLGFIFQSYNLIPVLSAARERRVRPRAPGGPRQGAPRDRARRPSPTSASRAWSTAARTSSAAASSSASPWPGPSPANPPSSSPTSPPPTSTATTGTELIALMRVAQPGTTASRSSSPPTTPR
jgi:putative ABC transport system permease protein